MTTFTDVQQEMLARLTLAYPNGLAFDDAAAIEVGNELVASGHLVRVEFDDDDADLGVAYQLSAELAEAHRHAIEQHAAEAEQN